MTLRNFFWTLTTNDEVSSKENSKLKNRRPSKTDEYTNVMLTHAKNRKRMGANLKQLQNGK